MICPICKDPYNKCPHSIDDIVAHILPIVTVHGKRLDALESAKATVAAEVPAKATIYVIGNVSRNLDGTWAASGWGSSTRTMESRNRIKPNETLGGWTFEELDSMTKSAQPPDAAKPETPPATAKPAFVREIDGKYATDSTGQIVKRATGEVLPVDEPLFMFRAKAELAVDVLMEYRKICIASNCDFLHIVGVEAAINKFGDFRVNHPERMKKPGKPENTGAENKVTLKCSVCGKEGIFCLYSDDTKTPRCSICWERTKTSAPSLCSKSEKVLTEEERKNRDKLATPFASISEQDCQFAVDTIDRLAIELREARIERKNKRVDMCSYCEKRFGNDSNAANEHVKMCPKNPLVAERTALQTQLAEAQAAKVTLTADNERLRKNVMSPRDGYWRCHYCHFDMPTEAEAVAHDAECPKHPLAAKLSTATKRVRQLEKEVAEWESLAGVEQDAHAETQRRFGERVKQLERELSGVRIRLTDALKLADDHKADAQKYHADLAKFQSTTRAGAINEAVKVLIEVWDNLNGLDPRRGTVAKMVRDAYALPADAPRQPGPEVEKLLEMMENHGYGSDTKLFTQAIKALSELGISIPPASPAKEDSHLPTNGGGK